VQALTALDRPGGSYATALRDLAEALPAPPQRGQTVRWRNQEYRLNRKAVRDLHTVKYACQHIVHLHYTSIGDKALLFREHRPYPHAEGNKNIPCPQGHAAQLKAKLFDKQEPVWCALCKETPHFTVAAQNLNPEQPEYFNDPDELPPQYRDGIKETLDSIPARYHKPQLPEVPSD